MSYGTTVKVADIYLKDRDGNIGCVGLLNQKIRNNGSSSNGSKKKTDYFPLNRKEI